MGFSVPSPGPGLSWSPKARSVALSPRRQGDVKCFFAELDTSRNGAVQSGMSKRKNPAAIALGRLGGAASGHNLARLSPDELREHQQAAAKARWDALTPAQRKAAMRKVRQGKRKQNRRATKAIGKWLADTTGAVPAPHVTLYADEPLKRKRKT